MADLNDRTEKNQFGIITHNRLEYEPRDLLRFPHKRKPLVGSYFGQNTYDGNLEKMKEKYTCSPEYPKISFREATISEAISACAYDFKNIARKQILTLHSWGLQLGLIVMTSEGVFTNPPKDKTGKPIQDEEKLKQLLNGVQPVNGIYLLDDSHDFGFAPYETFGEYYWWNSYINKSDNEVQAMDIIHQV